MPVQRRLGEHGSRTGQLCGAGLSCGLLDTLPSACLSVEGAENWPASHWSHVWCRQWPHFLLSWSPARRKALDGARPEPEACRAVGPAPRRPGTL